MTKKAIDVLDERLRNHICTLQKSSFDSTNKESMCESKLLVVNFDKIPNEYSRGKGWHGVPKSNDALYVNEQGVWYFIEFKNGTIEKDEIFRKLYDSLIMLIDWGVIPNFSFVRDNINYILVYNSNKYGKIPESPAREETYSYIMGLASQEERLFGIDKLEGYLFNQVHTYTKNLFEREFIIPMEKEEGIEN